MTERQYTRTGEGRTGASPVRREPTNCCKAWEDLPAERRAKWGWQVLHQWSHSRIPFSAQRLSDVGRLDDVEAAGKAIEIALQRKWIFRADRSASGGAELYVGRLTARKR